MSIFAVRQGGRGELPAESHDATRVVLDAAATPAGEGPQVAPAQEQLGGVARPIQGRAKVDVGHDGL